MATSAPPFRWPQNQKFARAFEAKAGKISSYYSEATSTNMRWITEAIKAVGGKVEDRPALLAARRKVEIKDTARGPLSVDAYGNPVQNIYVRKVERVGGKLQNTVIATIPAVSQFWKYTPDDYLKQPLVQPGLSTVQALLDMGAPTWPPSLMSPGGWVA